jgi:PilZ domain
MKIPLREFAEVIECLRSGATASRASELRRSTRMEVWATVDIFPVDGGETDQPRVALARDISIEGIGILTSLSPRIGTKMVVFLPRGKTVASFMLCNVAFCGPAAHGIFNLGCSFDSALTIDQCRLIQETAKANLAKLRNAILG